LAFALARKLEDYDSKKKVTILYEVIETAPSETVVIDRVKYQKSLNFTGKIDNYFSEYLEILNYYKELTGIDYEIRYQHEFNEQSETQEIFNTVLKNREYVAKKLDQKYGNLRVRMSCPICGLTDKNSVNNVYTEDTITFYCPEHGEYSVMSMKGFLSLNTILHWEIWLEEWVILQQTKVKTTILKFWGLQGVIMQIFTKKNWGTK